MSRTVRDYGHGVSCLAGKRQFKGFKKDGSTVGADGMVMTKSESTWDHDYKKHSSRKERREAKRECGHDEQE